MTAILALRSLSDNSLYLAAKVMLGPLAVSNTLPKMAPAYCSPEKVRSESPIMHQCFPSGCMSTTARHEGRHLGMTIRKSMSAGRSKVTLTFRQMNMSPAASMAILPVSVMGKGKAEGQYCMSVSQS